MKIQSRPISLSEIADLSESESDFGRNLADFEHELVKITSRRGLLATISDRPNVLSERFATGKIANAWLAAYAEELAATFKLPYPDWIWDSDRFLEEPYIHDAHSKRLKVWHILKSPDSFSRRNLFVAVSLPNHRLRRGRPPKSDAHKREMNRIRVARHRAKINRN